MSQTLEQTFEDSSDVIEHQKKIAVGEELLEATKKEFLFITGVAGTGKTHTVKLLNQIDKNYVELGGTTGISAINLGTRTINSILKYFNTRSLRDSYESGLLHKNLRILRKKGKRVLGIEEVSMLPAQQLDLIFDAISEINNDSVGKTGKLLGLHLIGDFAQLPPVKIPPENSEFAFKANCWEEFDKNTVKLEKIWRQDNPDFINAINFIRGGDGKNGVPLLKDCGVNFIDSADNFFDGTTIITKNDGVDDYNNRRLNQIDGKVITVQPTKRGSQLPEWDKQIPLISRYKINSYIMILNNDVETWSYVNGDCGWIRNYNESEKSFDIELKRTGKIVTIKEICRKNLQSDEPTKKHFSSMFSPSVDYMTGDWILGTIEYYPLRLAYATTVHKSQGLSLDRVQIDSRNSFFGFPSMSYVSISRCRTPENLFIIGKEKDLINKVNSSPEIKKWL